MLPIIPCSSFDEYATEVKSGRLEWSPVHRLDKFWVSFIIPCASDTYELGECDSLPGVFGVTATVPLAAIFFVHKVPQTMLTR